MTFCVGIFAVLGALCLLDLSTAYTRSSNALPSVFLQSLWPVAIIALSPIPIFVFYCFHARLILSETGVRWRNWGDWRQTSWNGVRDYYDHAPKPDNWGRVPMTIETEAGNITLDRRWRESEGVRRMVQEQARQTETAEWGVQGQRASGIDVRVFAYRQNDFWTLIIIGSMIILPYTVFGWHTLMMHPKAGSVWKVLNSGWMPGNLWGSLTADAPLALSWLVLAYCFTYPLLLLVAQVPELLDMGRRRAERITTRHSGITFDDGRQSTTVAWDEVTGYFLEPSVLSQSPFLRATALTLPPRKNWRWVFIIETKQGDFQYSSVIDGWQQLGEIIKERAIPLQKRNRATR